MEETVVRPGRLRTFSALRVRAYRYYWLGILASYLAMAIQWPTQAWLAYELTHSAFLLGLVSAAWGFPVLLFSAFGGIVADRVPKRDVLIWSRVWISIVTVVIATLIAIGRIEYWHLLAGSLLLGFAYAFSMGALQSIIPELVPPQLTLNAVALGSIGYNVTRIVGPALAGVFIGTIGTAGAYYISTAAYLISVAPIAMIPAVRRAGGKLTASAGRFLLEGLTYIRRNRIILTIVIMELVMVMVAMPFQAFMPAIAEHFKVEALGYGFLMAMMGGGALAGALTVASLGDFRRKGLLVLVAGIVYGLMLFLFPNAGSFGIALVLLLLVGVSSAMYYSTSNTLLQMNVTDGVRGRVMSVYMTVAGLQPIGILPMGALAEAIGAPLAVTATGIILFVFMALMLVFNRQMRQLP